MTGRSVRLAIRLYRRLLVLYPAPFRHEYGPLMVAAFEQLSEDAAEGGPVSLLRLWGHTLVDLAGSLLVQHLDEKGRWIMSRQFWALWILASVVGWLGAGGLLLSRRPDLALPVGAALVSALHILLLQRFAAPPGWWRLALLLMIGSWLLPVALFALLVAPLSGLSNLPFLVASGGLLLVSALLLGLLQGLALRSLVRSPWQWAAVPAGALLGAGAIALVLMVTLLPLSGNLMAYGIFSIRLRAGFISPLVAHEMGIILPLLNLLIALVAAVVYGLVLGGGLIMAAERARDRRLLL